MSFSSFFRILSKLIEISLKAHVLVHKISSVRKFYLVFGGGPMESDECLGFKALKKS